MEKSSKKAYLLADRYGLFRHVPDKWLIFLLYTVATGKFLRLKNPVTFNEKIQWMKLYDHNPLYTMVADKYAVRRYVKEKAGENYLIPLLARWDNPDEISFAGLPQQFVLKCNHDSGGVVICDDIDMFDTDKAIRKLKQHYCHNQYYVSREWAYKNIKKCILCEKYLIDEQVKELRDYKFFCFQGVPRIIQVDFGRRRIHKRNLYTPKWQFLDFTIKCPNDPKAEIEKPENLEEMLEVAAKLSRGFLQVRVDLYSVNGKTYFGEMTLYHGGGIEPFSSEEYAVYDMVRSLLNMMGLDRENFGKKCWNPLGTYIRPGDYVVIKPNFVMHLNENKKVKKNSMECLITHPSCLRALCDYCLIALKGRGEVVIADAPMQDCNLQTLLDKIHFTELLAFYHRQNKKVSFADLRKYQSEFNVNKVIVNRIYQKGKAVDVDMGSLSLHERRSGARTYQVDNYASAETGQYHGEHRHIYSINQIVLKADVVINFCKPKSHRLAGFTAAMKNMVGIVFDKASLPHYTAGPVEEGGDAYLHASRRKKMISNLLEKKIEHENRQQIFRATFDRYAYVALVLFERQFGKDPYLKGIWGGNDTIWRTVIDLNYIIRFADKEGKLHRNRQRKVLNFGDMIIAGEHNGPCRPQPKRLGILMASESAVAMDRTFCKMAGFWEEKIPMIKALREHKADYLIAGADEKIMIHANTDEYQGDLNAVKFPEEWHFRPHDAWNSI